VSTRLGRAQSFCAGDPAAQTRHEVGSAASRDRRRLDAESRPTSVRSLGFTARYVAVTVDEYQDVNLPQQTL
jgi:hypothetical protein